MMDVLSSGMYVTLAVPSSTGTIIITGRFTEMAHFGMTNVKEIQKKDTFFALLRQGMASTL